MRELTDSDKNSLALIASRLDQVVGGLTKLGVAIVGYRSTNHWTGALTGLIALRLAEGGNVPGGVVGTGILGIMGLTQVVPAVLEPSAVAQIDPHQVIDFTDWIRSIALPG